MVGELSVLPFLFVAGNFVFGSIKYGKSLFFTSQNKKINESSFEAFEEIASFLLCAFYYFFDYGRFIEECCGYKE